jgi:hypothetical protein
MTAFAALITDVNDREQEIARQRPAHDRRKLEARTAQRNPPKNESILNKRIPLGIGFLFASRIEGGQSARAYFTRKWLRFGSLGEHEALNPYLDQLRDGEFE